jgi:beta-lactamase regulating signal transducer with metallopeptidase domain
MTQQISEILSMAWQPLWAHLWQTSLVLIVVLLVAAIMRRAPASFLNALLWIGLAKLFVPLPLIKNLLGGGMTRAFHGLASGGPVARVSAPLIGTTTTLFDASRSVLANGPRPDSAASLLAAAAWVAGSAALALYWSGKSRPWYGLAALSLSDGPADVRRRLTGAMRTTSIRTSDVLVTGEPIAPCVMGIVRPRIIVPCDVVRAVGRSEQGWNPPVSFCFGSRQSCSSSIRFCGPC